MSLIPGYNDSHLLFNNNFLSETSQAGTFGYRGELVLVEGEIADTKGHAKPPEEVMRGVALLGSDKLDLVVGAIDKLEFLTTFVEKYKGDFSENMLSVIYVVNIEKAIQVELEGVTFVLIPLLQGVPWNEVIDELALEKSDFKGQSSADKIVTLYSELKSYKPKYPTISMEQALSEATDAVREAWGAV